MAEDKNSFVAYCDWGKTFDELSDEEAGKLVKHLFDYVRDKNPESDKLTKLLFIPIQDTLKRDLKKYEKYVDKQKANGAKGGRPSKPKKPKPLSENPTEPKKADSVSVSDSVSDSDSVNDINKIPFSDFWDSYDKKVGSLKSIEKKWDKIKLETQTEIIDYLYKYKKAQPDKKFRKNPDTFLNQKSWKDEIIESNSKGTKDTTLGTHRLGTDFSKPL